MKYFLIILVIFTLSGCSNPGYSTRIDISEKAGATKGDFFLITSILQSKSYDTLMDEEKGLHKIESYKIKLDEKKFSGIERKYIGLAVEYWCTEERTFEQNALCKIQVRIGNPWEGKKTVLKNEIDKITDLVVANLSERFSESKIKVRRAYSSPI